MTWLINTEWSNYIAAYVVEETEIQVDLYFRYKSWYLPFFWDNLLIRVNH